VSHLHRRSCENLKYHILIQCFVFFCISVGLPMNYVLDGHGSIPRQGFEIFSSPQRADKLWCPPSFLYNGYRGTFPRRWSGGDVKLTTHVIIYLRFTCNPRNCPKELMNTT
jgi:hypothetical protein